MIEMIIAILAIVLGVIGIFGACMPIGCIGYIEEDIFFHGSAENQIRKIGTEIQKLERISWYTLACLGISFFLFCYLTVGRFL